jgi:hypothetical protein
VATRSIEKGKTVGRPIWYHNMRQSGKNQIYSNSTGLPIYAPPQTLCITSDMDIADYISTEFWKYKSAKRSVARVVFPNIIAKKLKFRRNIFSTCQCQELYFTWKFNKPEPQTFTKRYLLIINYINNANFCPCSRPPSICLHNDKFKLLSKANLLIWWQLKS